MGEKKAHTNDQAEMKTYALSHTHAHSHTSTLYIHSSSYNIINMICHIFLFTYATQHTHIARRDGGGMELFGSVGQIIFVSVIEML